ncbi:hypothetical protein ALI22I_13485 [Saccharothrix sp. ALI-22-I]|nr:hypothetical protein ALI22I_13485 [Saccharothrix sp. ALI-22-I]
MLPVLPSQAAFLHEFFPAMINPHYWNLCGIFRLSQRFDTWLVRAAVAQVWEHHQALRVRFRLTEGEWWQEIRGRSEPPPFRRIDLSRCPEDDQPATVGRICAEIQRTLHVHQGPLAGFVYFDLGVGQPPRLFVVVHHLVADALSLSTVVGDLENVLWALAEGRAPRLSQGAPYDECVRALRDYAASAEVTAEIPHWLGPRWARVSELPTDRTRYTSETVGGTESVNLGFDRGRSEALLRKLPAATGVDLHTTVLAAIGEAAGEWLGGEVGVAVVHHGRDLTKADGTPVFPNGVRHTMGWFSFGGFVALPPREGGDVVEHLRRTADSLTAMPNNGVGAHLLRWCAPNGPHAEALAAVSDRLGLIFNNMGGLGQPNQGGRVLTMAGDPMKHEPDVLQPRPQVYIRLVRDDGVLSMSWFLDGVRHEPTAVTRLVSRVDEVLTSYLRQLVP